LDRLTYPRGEPNGVVGGGEGVPLAGAAPLANHGEPDELYKSAVVTFRVDLGDRLVERAGVGAVAPVSRHLSVSSRVACRYDSTGFTWGVNTNRQGKSDEILSGI